MVVLAVLCDGVFSCGGVTVLVVEVGVVLLVGVVTFYTITVIRYYGIQETGRR